MADTGPRDTGRGTDHGRDGRSGRPAGGPRVRTGDDGTQGGGHGAPGARPGSTPGPRPGSTPGPRPGSTGTGPRPGGARRSGSPGAAPGTRPGSPGADRGPGKGTGPGPGDPAGGAGSGPAAGGGAPAPVRAAGCVLWRRSPHEGRLEIALVHRPRYDDWSHPKGKLKRGEDALRGAVREVLEETGIGCVPGAPLPTVRYPVRGRPKEVRYWAAEADPEDTFVPNREVDRMLWLPPATAREVLTHDHDRGLVDALLSVLHQP